jgi:hypothetical protein
MDLWLSLFNSWLVNEVGLNLGKRSLRQPHHLVEPQYSEGVFQGKKVGGTALKPKKPRLFRGGALAYQLLATLLRLRTHSQRNRLYILGVGVMRPCQPSHGFRGKACAGQCYRGPGGDSSQSRDER